MYRWFRESREDSCCSVKYYKREMGRYIREHISIQVGDFLKYLILLILG